MNGEFVLVPPVPEGLERVPYTKLCPMQLRTCPQANAFEIATPIKAGNVGAAIFHFGGLEFSCPSSDFIASNEMVSGAPLVATFTVYVFEECGEGCMVESDAVQGDFITKGGPGNGKMIMVRPKFEVTCENLLCVFIRNSFHYAVTGGMPATLVTPGEYVMNKRAAGSDMGCPSSLKWSGPNGGGMTYSISEPNPFYVTE